jgi:hypothetical protein
MYAEPAEPMEGNLTADEVQELQSLLTPRLMDLLTKVLPESAGVLAEYGGAGEDPFDDPGQAAMNGEQAPMDPAAKLEAMRAAAAPPMPMPGAPMPPAPMGPPGAVPMAQTGLSRMKMGAR